MGPSYIYYTDPHSYYPLQTLTTDERNFIAKLTPIRLHHPFKLPLQKNEQDTKRRRRHKPCYMVRASTTKHARCLASQRYIFSVFKESEMVFNFCHLLPTIRCYDTEHAVRNSESEEEKKSD
ncbi:hypothetical protein WN51_13772 [Melipona quadrifasciata]|uniref:Uncharacterized protein n=1 Tax=Melipona quadrifasciata TaxID=166423 RepID=A0A0N1ITK6_9HYME|nr:hypothetical protein WN51_13772 [Melipona quadrifasciata]